MIQLVGHVRQADGVDIEYGGRVRVRPHLWRIAGDKQQIVQSQGCRAEQVRHHTEQISVAATVMQNGLNADLAFDEHGSRLSRHSRLCTRAVGNIYAVNTCGFQQPDRIERFLRIAAFWRQNLD